MRTYEDTEGHMKNYEDMVHEDTLMETHEGSPIAATQPSRCAERILLPNYILSTYDTYDRER